MDAQPHWASGRLRDNSRVGVIICWFFTLLWNIICWPIAASVLLSPAKHGVGEKWLVLLFPSIGLIGLALAIYLTVRYLKFGKSVLELETLPGSIGGWFAGTVQTSVALRDAENVRVSLRCVRRVTRGSGKRRRTSQTTLGEEEQTLTGRLAINREGGNTIPVSFRIPRGCEPTFDKKKVTAKAGDTPQYSVLAATRDGKNVWLVSNLRSADTTQVVQEIRKSLGQHVDHAERPEHQADDPVDGEERQADF